jgi:ribosomal protein L11 methyltransferase
MKQTIGTRNRAGVLWQFSITVGREAEEAVAALLERQFGETAAVYAPENRPVSVVTVYARRQGGLKSEQRRALERSLDELARSGVGVEPLSIAVKKVPRTDWTTSWKKFFKTITVGSRLLIRPSWSTQRARRGQRVVILDPGLSFGTGQHPTTAFCLEELVRARKTGQAQSFLDIGTGSGILALAAVKLGYRPVRALDNDPLAVRIARANARRNRVPDRLTIVRQDLTHLPGRGRFQYDLVCANLVRDLLINEGDRIVNRLRPGGQLVVAGVLRSEFAEVQAAYHGRGLRLQRSQREAEWESGSFLKPCLNRAAAKRSDQ